jgi:UDP-N-acetylglucosamine--N-acetylmuramyl-(pentapeptide) pyrophosphoryl-undecaprenol N-acetylglucosamine transferase
MKVMIAAAGTGGHVFPGLAVASVLQQQGCDVHWLATAEGRERQWVLPTKLPYHTVDMQGLRGKGVVGWLKAPFRLAKGVWQAIAVLRREKPVLLLVMGGYISVPAGVAAWLLGIPVWMHEQNAIAGWSNKLLAPLADVVWCGLPLVSTPWVMRDAALMGNPLRQQLHRASAVAQSTGTLKILVLGGSQGAAFLNAMIPAALTGWSPATQCDIWHQTGQAEHEAVQDAYTAAALRARVDAFIHDMGSAYAWADVVISRSGALTVSELMQVARPALLIPFPYAVDNHQTANGQTLVDLGAAVLMPQAEVSINRLRQHIQAWLIDPSWLHQAYDALSRLPENHAATLMAEAIVATIKAESAEETSI